MENGKWKIRHRFLVLCLLPFAFFLNFACSVPNLELPECTASRNAVREFYSVHFDGSMQPSEDYLKKREKFLTVNLRNLIVKNTSDKRDYFTATDDYPKAFRVGECEVIAPDKTVFGVLIFWRDDTRTEQRKINVEAVKENDRWLINRTF